MTRRRRHSFLTTDSAGASLDVAREPTAGEGTSPVRPLSFQRRRRRADVTGGRADGRTDGDRRSMTGLCRRPTGGQRGEARAAAGGHLSTRTSPPPPAPYVRQISDVECARRRTQEWSAADRRMDRARARHRPAICRKPRMAFDADDDDDGRRKFRRRRVISLSAAAAFGDD